jgi:N-formylglutamate amidohydrolase
MSTPIYREYPSKTTQFKGLISIPHAGELFPGEFTPYLTSDKRALAEDVDYKVDELIDIEKLNHAGVHVIVADVHRTCLDLNRHPSKACLNWIHNTQGVQLVAKTPDEQTRQKLTEKYHTPYYKRLTELIHEHSTSKRLLPVIDLHSMPSRPTAHHLKQNPDQKMDRADTCISDWNGQSCTSEYIDFIIETLIERGIGAAKNDPYYGGYLTQYMSDLPCENVQIEINRLIYMDEKKRELIDSEVAKLKPALTDAIIEIFNNF